MMAAGKEKLTLGDLLNQPREEEKEKDFITPMPLSEKKRVCALKKLQSESIQIEAKFYSRVHALEKEFETEFNKIYEKRRQIVNGEHDPTEEEISAMPLIQHCDEDQLKALYDKSEPETGFKGIKDFWLNVLKSTETTSDLIREHDEPILAYLTDITNEVTLQPEGFIIKFHFAKNPYFSNTVLTKSYSLQMTPDPEDPFEFDGPIVTETKGDKIEWEEGKNVTKKVIKKKSKKNGGKFMTKSVKNESFFNFFDPPVLDKDADPESEHHSELTDLLRTDFEVGQILRDHILPRAVLFLTGESNYDEDDMFDFDGEDEDEEEDDLSDDE